VNKVAVKARICGSASWNGATYVDTGAANGGGPVLHSEEIHATEVTGGGDEVGPGEVDHGLEHGIKVTASSSYFEPDGKWSFPCGELSTGPGR